MSPVGDQAEASLEVTTAGEPPCAAPKRRARRRLRPAVPRLITLVLFAAHCAAPASAENYRVTIESATSDRAGQVVTFHLPAGLNGEVVLRDDAGREVPLQVESDRTACFIVPAQKSGETATFALARGTPAVLGSGVRVLEEPTPPRAGKSPDPAPRGAVAGLVRKPGRLRLSVGGTPALYYQMDPEALPRDDIAAKYKRAGYLHPVLTPSGKIISDDYPAQHIHHHGIWAPWTKTEFQGRTPDFWNMGTQTGTVEFVQLDRTWSGPVHGGFAAWQRFIDLSAPRPVTALNETWQVTLYNLPAASVGGGEGTPVRMFDLVITQTCATADALSLPPYHYGGVALRGRGEWYGATKAFFLTSEGEADRVKANATRARWCHLGGDVEGAFAGAAVLSHPKNFRAPQPLRVHPEEPYFCFAPSILGSWAIEPGKPYVARYRFIVADGAPNAALLDACWNAYASEAKVTITPGP